MSTIQTLSRHASTEWRPDSGGSYSGRYCTERMEVLSTEAVMNRDSDDADSKETNLTVSLVYCDVVLAELQRKGIALPNPEDIRRNLLCHPDMTDLVKRICDDALDRFPRPSQVALELYQDPEIEDEHLTVYVRQYDYDDDILDVLDEVRLKFHEERATSSNWIHITTDFELPI